MNNYRRADLMGRKHFGEDFDPYYITAGTEDDTDRIDAYATARTNHNRTYAIEIKDYTNTQHRREYIKFIHNGIDYGYQIDYDKIEYLTNISNEQGRIPILYVRFNDYTIVWDLSNIDWKSRAKMVSVNKDGQNYGKEKEYALQTYLYFNENRWYKLTDN